MSLHDLRSRIPFGMGTVALIGAALLALTGGLVLWGSPSEQYTAGDGGLRHYSSEPATAWTVEDSTLPGYAGTGQITVEDHHGDDWLVSYPSGYGRSFLLIDAANGTQQWSEPVRAGLGDCGLDDDGRAGCAVKLGSAPDGFYLADGTGALTRVGDLHDTAHVYGFGHDFLRVNQVGYQVGLYDAAGSAKWTRTFAAAATPHVNDGMLVIATADGSSSIVDPATGADQRTCTQCRMQVYPHGVLEVHEGLGQEAVITHSRDGARVGPATRTAKSLAPVPGPSTLPVLTGAGEGQVMIDDGHYEIVDPGSGTALWQIGDPQLSKANTRPCGETVAFARKDRSRVFFALADGTRLGSMPPPDIEDPDSNLDLLQCVGASGETAVFANRDALTAYDTKAGKVAWTLPINGTAQAIDGYLVLTQGTSLSVLRPH
ncbi:MAG: hypothetical protein QM774_09050 [Gordonia sp. (in: high G+C Gram-positive bacteria)]|uniref:hypothetical protein n=1 Tax=Gordonia sp. (in: high G+C Gram-positive bacteria) TaxID=84139 RepID=UPI0039E58F34